MLKGYWIDMGNKQVSLGFFFTAKSCACFVLTIYLMRYLLFLPRSARGRGAKNEQVMVACGAELTELIS